MMPMRGVQLGGGGVFVARGRGLGIMLQDPLFCMLCFFCIFSFFLSGVSLFFANSLSPGAVSVLSSLSNIVSVMVVGVRLFFAVPQPAAEIFPVRRERRRWGG